MIKDDYEIVPRRHPGRWVFSLLIALLVVLLVWQVARNEIFHFSTVPAYMFDPRILTGVWITLYITCGSMLIGLVLGIMLAVMRVSDNPVMRSTAGAFIWFFRGTPVLVQLIFWFNIGIIFPSISLGIPGGPVMFDISTNALMTATLTALLGLGLNEGAYMSEIVRAAY